MAKIERTKNATRNIIFGVILKAYQIIVPFLMRTAMIYLMGVQYLGLNSLFTSILQVLNLAELGVGSAMIYSMYKPIAEDDNATICALMKLYKTYYRIIGLVIAVIGCALTPFIKDDLLAGKLVLFSGTGCQVNGLKNFLGKEYDNLLCVDVICHGTPSPALWKKYAEYQEKKNGGKLKGINFRCKDDSWTDFGMKEVLAELPQGEAKQLYISKDKDPYMQMFLRNYCLRPSCYDCAAKKVKMADLTIADFWGINDVAPEMNDGNGTSLILIRTDKGMKEFETISSKLKLKEVAYEDGVKSNPAEYKSCCRPSQRDTFFEDMDAMEFEELEKKYASPIKVTFKSRVKRKIKNTIKSALRAIGGQRV